MGHFIDGVLQEYDGVCERGWVGEAKDIHSDVMKR